MCDTGVAMLVGVNRSMHLVHEILGLAFVVGTVLHMLVHGRALEKYFSKKLALGVMGAVFVASAALIAAGVMMPPKHRGEQAPKGSGHGVAPGTQPARQ